MFSTTGRTQYLLFMCIISVGDSQESQEKEGGDAESVASSEKGTATSLDPFLIILSHINFLYQFAHAQSRGGSKSGRSCS